MGMLIDGQWHDQWYETKENKGKFNRENARFRHWITEDGTAGATGKGGFKAEKGRYHLYVSHACPWAHRTLIFRKLKALETLIDISVVSPRMLNQGWEYDTSTGAIADPVINAEYHHQLYTRDTPDYTGRVTVPLLWDKQTNKIVSNESSEIIRMFNTAFNELSGNNDDYYPEALHANIDSINERVYRSINNGVYRAGFATTQEAYNEAVNNLFSSIEALEVLLGNQRYIAGDVITEADWRLFTTLVRFDAVYYGHFKCNLKQLKDYPSLWAYTRELYQWPGVAETVNMKHIKEHYYYSHQMINPTRIIPAGPELDFMEPHNRS